MKLIKEHTEEVKYLVEEKLGKGFDISSWKI